MKSETRRELIKKIEDRVLTKTASDAHRHMDNQGLAQEISGYQRGVNEMGYWVAGTMLHKG